MKFMRLAFSLAASLACVCGSAYAADFKSIGAAPAIMFDAPSLKGKRVFIAPRGMPVEVVLTNGDWVKVRDMAGDLSWVQASALAPRRSVVVKAASVRVRAATDDAAAAVFTCERGVLLEPIEPVPGGWLKVRHRDGLTGFVKLGEVWGV